MRRPLLIYAVKSRASHCNCSVVAPLCTSSTLGDHRSVRRHLEGGLKVRYVAKYERPPTAARSG